MLSFLKGASGEACFDLSKVASLPWERAAGEAFDDLAKGALLSLLGTCFDFAMGASLSLLEGAVWEAGFGKGVLLSSLEGVAGESSCVSLTEGVSLPLMEEAGFFVEGAISSLLEKLVLLLLEEETELALLLFCFGTGTGVVEDVTGLPSFLLTLDEGR